MVVREMTVRSCAGCGARHECHDPLFAGHDGYRVAWTRYEKIGRSHRERGVATAGRVVEVHPAEYGPDGKGWRTKADELVVECDDGEVRVIEDWMFLQSLGTLRVLEPAR